MLSSSQEVGAERELAALRGEHRPLDPDDVADVEGKQTLVCLAELVEASLDLDLPGAVAEVEEGGLAVTAAGAQPAGDPVAVIRLGAGLEALVGLPDRGDLGPAREGVREGLDPRLAQALELCPSLGEKVRGESGSLTGRA